MTIWTTAEIIDFSFNLWLINCASHEGTEGETRIGLGAQTPKPDLPRPASWAEIWV